MQLRRLVPHIFRNCSHWHLLESRKRLAESREHYAWEQLNATSRNNRESHLEDGLGQRGPCEASRASVHRPPSLAQLFGRRKAGCILGLHYAVLTRIAQGESSNGSRASGTWLVRAFLSSAVTPAGTRIWLGGVRVGSDEVRCPESPSSLLQGELGLAAPEPCWDRCLALSPWLSFGRKRLTGPACGSPPPGRSCIR